MTKKRSFSKLSSTRNWKNITYPNPLRFRVGSYEESNERLNDKVARILKMEQRGSEHVLAPADLLEPTRTRRQEPASRLVHSLPDMSPPQPGLGKTQQGLSQAILHTLGKRPETPDTPSPAWHTRAGTHSRPVAMDQSRPLPQAGLQGRHPAGSVHVLQAHRTAQLETSTVLGLEGSKSANSA